MYVCMYVHACLALALHIQNELEWNDWYRRKHNNNRDWMTDIVEKVKGES